MSVKKPSVSVVMPVYNGEEFLQEVIESVQQQSMTDWEFIINDASTDRTEDIILDVAKTDTRIVYLKNEKNSGVAYSLNRGLDVAQGEYVARVDADDPIYKYRFELQKDYMDKHPEIGILASGYVYDDGTIEKVHFPRFLRKNEIKASFIIANSIAHSTVMLRKEVFDKFHLRYDVAYKLEDYELWTRAIEYTEAAVLKQILIKHRVHPASVCQNMGTDFYDNINKIIKKYMKNIYHIDVDKYSKEHFYDMGYNLKSSVKENYYQYAADEYKLLCEIERANDEVHFVDGGTLAKVLKIKWNWVLRSLNLDKSSYRVLPVLEENETGDFRQTVVNELLEKKIVKSLKATDEEVVSYIVSPIISIRKKKLIVYGLGVKCYSYFEPVLENVDENRMNIVAFCDKDKEIIGDSFMKKKVITPEEILGEDYDIIAVTSGKFFTTIKDELTYRYGVPEEKIVKMEELGIVL